MKRLLLATALLITPHIVQAAQEKPTPLILRAIAKTFRDPSSVKFGPAFYSEVKNPNGRHLCVWANAKNAYGGYAGEELMVFMVGAQEYPNVAPWVLFEASNKGDIVGVSRVCLSPKDMKALGY